MNNNNEYDYEYEYDNTNYYNTNYYNNDADDDIIRIPTRISTIQISQTEEQYARMVQAEIELEEQKHEQRQHRRRQQQQRQQQQRRTSSMSATALSTCSRDSSNSSDRSGSTAPSTDDEAVACRIQQELQDAEYIQHISLQEQQEIASEGIVQSLERQQQQQQQLEAEQHQQQRPPKSCIAIFLSMAALDYYRAKQIALQLHAASRHVTVLSSSYSLGDPVRSMASR